MPLEFEQEQLPVTALADNLHRIASTYKEHWVAHVMSASVRLRQMDELVQKLTFERDAARRLNEELEQRLAHATQPSHGGRPKPRL